uniref:Uncharacterized protein n=1 Tax=Avena sativa TaxID=4498 RepID=A0ACD6A131_AVESA
MEATTARSTKRKSAAEGAHGPNPRAEGRSAPHDPPPAGATEEDGGGVDRISALPDAVLGEIISFLPTKDGARTQILSPRWRHLWRSAPLNLDSNGLVSYWKNLAGVVSRVLSSHQGPGRRFRLSTLYTREDKATVEAFLQSPALDNLQELDLYCYGPFLPPPPSTFRFSPTLRVAHIRECSILDAHVQGLHFPLLKHLGLDTVTISECSLQTLIARCPAIEFLLMGQCYGFHRLRINSLTIRGIGIHNNDYIEIESNNELHELIIDNAPCLQRLLLPVSAGLDILVGAAPKLDTIGFLSDEGCRSNNQDHLNRLQFGSTVIQGLRVDKLATVVRTVKILAVRMKALCLDTVIGLITCFPCLEKLYIGASKSGSSNLWQRKRQNLIKCLDFCPKKIVLQSYRGVKSEVNFVTFFVLNPSVLELMTIEVDSKYYCRKFLAEQRQKLQLENRASRGAQFNFTDERGFICSWGMKHVCDLEIDPFV